MSAPNPAGNNGEDGNGNHAAVAKTAGIIVFSGIAISIIKTLTSKNKSHKSPSLQESKKPITQKKKSSPKMRQTIEIVKGDTLWGLSRKYGVSIDAIKEANGLTGNTIYAGKKLVIP
ncbi:uncharacterized protein LOC143889269 [Tasmannia lanceolata]|uniref:uncharacterized protein LOC143889269 n=1 Tax=Tasmannia lanceolata TaxID=3420 RepID=UPI00406284A1